MRPGYGTVRNVSERNGLSYKSGDGEPDIMIAP